MPPKAPPRRSIEDILKELNSEFEGRQAPVPPPVKATPKVEKKPEKVIPVERYDDPVEHHVNTGKSMAEIRKEIKKEKHMVDEEFEVDFDLTQAVINDAILNRPYQ